MIELTQDEVQRQQIMNETFLIAATQYAFTIPVLLEYIGNFESEFKNDKQKIFGDKFLQLLKDFKDKISKNQEISGLSSHYEKVFDYKKNTEEMAKQICFDLFTFMGQISFLVAQDVAIPFFEALPLLNQELPLILDMEKKERRSAEFELIKELAAFYSEYQNFYINQTRNRIREENKIEVLKVVK